MRRSMTLAMLLAGSLLASHAGATSADAPDAKSREWSNRLCANCLPPTRTVEAPASRLEPAAHIATKLVAANTCADPGSSAWFAEEEDHLTAFLNSAAPAFK
jgi:hypothetical protein